MSVATDGSSRKESLTLAVLAALAVGLWWATPTLIMPYRAEQAWYESAGTFPRLALSIIVLAGAVGALKRWRGKSRSVSDELDSTTASMPRVAMALALFVGYVLAVPVLGFAVASALFLAFTARAVGLSWRTAWLLGLPMALTLWLLFVRVLKVSFGHGLLF